MERDQEHVICTLRFVRRIIRVMKVVEFGGAQCGSHMKRPVVVANEMSGPGARILAMCHREKRSADGGVPSPSSGAGAENTVRDSASV